ncbi:MULTISPECIES: helix-turn-helix domain-containing protein [unclassified Streptomyces]|uniref:helix-turn-helix domain-containing protein n=1 Tax=unclassified Streptomyces TaxID=2593676 RepID=UPI002DDC6401|nr:helix-turn-helix domain-containing protein [Streptomyces sp. NBC_01445]WSE11401.1 helix-turn-helix domain-containing protein [Streptomyces sp. NBC_01445]
MSLSSSSSNTKPKPKPRLTPAAIARGTGVSTATVSKVVNGRADVVPGTRTRGLAALEEAGYRSPAQRRSPVGPSVVEVAFDAIGSD